MIIPKSYLELGARVPYPQNFATEPAGQDCQAAVIASRLKELRGENTENRVGVDGGHTSREALRGVGGSCVLDPNAVDYMEWQLGGKKKSSTRTAGSTAVPAGSKKKTVPATAAATNAAVQVDSTYEAALAAAKSLAGKEYVFTTPSGTRLNVEVLAVFDTKRGGPHITPDGATRRDIEWLVALRDPLVEKNGQPTHLSFHADNERYPFYTHKWSISSCTIGLQKGERLYIFCDGQFMSIALCDKLEEFLKGEDIRDEVFAQKGSKFDRCGVKIEVIEYNLLQDFGLESWGLGINDGEYTLKCLSSSFDRMTLINNTTGEGAVQLEVGSKLTFKSPQTGEDVEFTVMHELLVFLREENARNKIRD